MATADKLTYLNDTKNLLKSMINYGLDTPLTNEPFRDYVSSIFKAFIESLNNPDTLWGNLPKITGTGTNISLNNTIEAPMKIELSPSELTQDGTPTPSSPQAVHSISGSNTIKVSGLQQFNNDNINVTAFVTKIDTGIKLNNAWASGVLLNSQVLEQLKPNTKYTCRVLEKITSRPDTITENQHTLALYRSGSGSLPTVFTPIVEDSTPKRTATLNTNVEYLRTFTTPADLTNVILLGYTFRDSNGNNGTIELAEFMLVEGEYTSENFPQYEAYNKTDYNINLGKNLLNTLYAHDSGYETTNNGIKYTLNNDGSITISGTASSLSAFNTYGTFNSTTIIQPLDSSKNYTLSTNTLPSGVSVYVRVYDGSNLESKLTSTSITFTGKTGITAFYVQVANGTVISTPITIYPQIELGSTPSSYAQYFTPIEYCKIGNYEDKIFRTSGKNLFDKDSATYKSGYTKNDSGVESSLSGFGYTTNYINVKPNTQYTINGSITTTGYFLRIYYYDSSKNWISRSAGADTMPFTFTTPNNCQYIQFQYFESKYNANTIMINEGTTALPYEPYGSNEWYIKKNIGKVVLDGSEDGWASTSSATGYYRFTTNQAITNRANNYYGINNRFIQRTTQAHGEYEYLYFDSASQYIYIQIETSRLSGNTVNDFKTWLASNNTTIYYILATPTYTKIEGTLAEQLEAVKKSKDGDTNISQVNNDLGFVMSATALEDLA